MSLSIESKLKEIMKNEAAVEILEEYIPGFRKSPNLKLAQGMSLEKIIRMTPGLKDAGNAEEIDSRLQALGD
jgi:hypothetical protein